MLKKLILSAALLLGVLTPAAASADYVCAAEYFGGAPRLKLTLTSSANCAGSSKTYWICDSTSPSNSATCGILRYAKDEILNLHTALSTAAHTQQYVAPSTTTCGNGAVGCLYSVSFRQ
jgi:hypothetical protein